MGYVIAVIGGVVVGFVFSALLSANKCGECLVERQRKENPSTAGGPPPFRAREAEDE